MVNTVNTTPGLWWETSVGNLRLGFTSIAAGNLAHHVSDPEQAQARRRELEIACGMTPGSLRFLDQTHSPDVLNVADYPANGPTPTGDAWVSDGAAEPLAIMVADCLPVLFAATTSTSVPITAAAHAGRPGLLAGILENTVEALNAAGAVHITAWIGPGACGDCYEIPEQMVEELTAHRPALRSRTRWGTSALNLRAEAQHLLTNAGVKVVDVPGCTIENPELFSHRRSQRTGEPAGRIAGLIWQPTAVH